MSRLIFSRRATQRALEALRGAIPEDARSDLVLRLNRPGRDRLSAVWEAAVLSAIAQSCAVAYEQPLDSGRRPDFKMLWSHCGHDFSIAGDVTTVSDQGLHDRNPRELLRAEMDRLVKKHGLKPTYFHENVRGRITGEWPDQRMTLCLPERADIATFARRRIEPFLREVRLSPEACHSLDIHDGEAQVSISYDPSRKYGGGGYTSYNVALSLTKNPIRAALDKKKGQLRGAPSDTIRIVFLCDAGCGAMRQSMNPGTTKSPEAICQEFLGSTSAIDLVVLITIDRVSPFQVRSPLRLDIKPVASQRSARNGRLNDQTLSALQSLLEAICKHLPHPVQDAQNAYLQCETPGYGLGGHGGYEMNRNMIRVSSRELLELLTKWEASKPQRYDRGETPVGSLATRAIADGRMIRSLQVIDGGVDIDDDYVEIKFGDPDAAISPFA